MYTVVGPVLTRNGGYAFDCWTPENGLSSGYTYHRVQDALYARNVEIRSHNKGSENRAIACNTVDDFARSADPWSTGVVAFVGVNLGIQCRHGFYPLEKTDLAHNTRA